MSECPNASEPNFASTQCDFQFHYNLWVIRAHQDIRPFRKALRGSVRFFLLLMTSSAWTCLQYSRNLEPTF